MGSTSTECTLDFGPAMSQFQSMFPDISPTVIELVLRKHNGDVSSTIDDLLAVSSKDCSSSSSSCSAQPVNLASSSSFGSNSCQTVSVPAPAEKRQQKPLPNCVDDEKIALLIQNREFLNYLQQDPQFMREINSEYMGNSRRHRQPHRSSGARLLSASRPFDSPHSRCYSQQTSYSQSTYQQKDNCRPPAVPNGPIVDFSEGSIPNGPMVDCPKSTANWSQKLKSHLPLAKNSSSSRNQAGPQPTVAEMYAEEPPTSDDYINNSEKHLTDRLHNMSRNSKSLLLTLAKKFSLSKRGGQDHSMRPTNYGDQSKDFSYQIHQN